MNQELALLFDAEESEFIDGRFVFDSLPYVDTVHEDYEGYALALIEEEMESIQPPKIRKLAPIQYRSDLMRTEMDYLAKTPDRPKLTFEPKAAESPSIESVEEWRKVVAAERTKFETERQRSIILEIENSDVSAQQWKHYTSMVLETIQEVTLDQLGKQRRRVDEINAERQQQQQKVGHTLSILTNQWHQLVQKKFKLETAIRGLEADVHPST